MSRFHILITGGCGFVGSSLAIMLKQRYPKYQVTALDNLKRRGSELNIPRLKENGVQFFHGDIRARRDLEIVDSLDILIDAAAESSVLAGITGSLNYLVETNFSGTYNCLELAAQKGAKFIFLSTSRVYPIPALDRVRLCELDTRFAIDDHQDLPGVDKKGISESFPLEGHRSFYGATKLASELLIQNPSV